MVEPSLRRACDRCHGQKLSCQRHGSESCARCIRAGKTCTTSASLRNLKRGVSDSRPCVGQDGGRHAARRRNPPNSQRLRALSKGGEETAGEDLIDDSSSLHTSRGVQQPSALDVVNWTSRPETPNPLTSADTSSEDIDATRLQAASCFSHWPGLDNLAGWDIDIDMDSVDPSDFNFTSPTGAKASDSTTTLDWKTMLPNMPLELYVSGGSGNETAENNTRTEASTSKPSLELSDTTTSPLEDGQWLSNLAHLNVKLFSQAKTMEARASIAVHGTQSMSTSSVILDEVLGLFFQFLDLLREHRTMIDHLQSLPSSASGSSTDTSTSSNLGLGPASNPTIPLAADAGSVLMMLSCYIRILEICTKVLAVIKASLAMGVSPNLNGTPFLHLAVGSTTIKDHYPLIRLRVLMELLEGLLDDMRASLTPDTESGGGGRRQFEESVKAFWDRSLYGQPQLTQHAIQLQEEKVFEIIRAIRIDLRRS